MKSPKRSTRGLLPGFRTEASPALHREDVPFDIVGPWIAFHGVDLASRTWHGSALVLVRIEPRAIAEADRRAAEAQAKQDAAQALHNNGGPLQVITTEDAEKDIKLQDLRTKIESLDDSSSSSSSSSSISLPSTPSPVLTPQASSLTLGDSPEPSPPRNPLRRTSSHEIEAFRASRESKRGLGEQAANPASKPGNSAFLAQTVSPIQSTQSTQTLQYPVQIPDTSQSVQTPDQAPDPPQSRMSAKPSLEITITVPASPDTPVHTLTLSDPLVLYAQMFEYSVFRFDLAIPQHPTCTTRIRYKVTIPNPHEYVAPHDELSELEFNIPGVTEKVHAAFFSCSGFEDTNREADQGVGNPGLWHDILRVHRIHPFHLLIGGGDQIYQDDVFDDVASLHRWMYGIPYQREREAHPWTQEMEEASECFYFRNACLHFGTTIVGDAMAVIPHLFVPDDHDFFDGIGSYPDHLNNCPVFQGIAKIATRQYLLFQQHTTPELAHRLNGMVPAATDGPLGRPHGFNFVYNLSDTMSIIGLDNRTERQVDQVFYPETIQAIFNRVESCIPYGTEHLLVMQPVPMIFGDIGALERPLERISKLFRRSKFWTEVIAKCGWWKNDQLKFGEPQLLDDCVDHWSSLHHQMERQMLFAKFGELATARSMRVSWLTGDVHCAGFGRLRTQGTTAETELYDPMTMYQVISSAIGNAPPPVLVRWLFEITDGPPWGVYRLTKRPAKPIKPSHVERTAAAEAASKHLRRADTFYDRIRAEYASRFVGRPIKQDPGDGQAVLGKVEEGLVRIGELELVAGARGGHLRHDDRETRRTMKRKLLRRRNWCEITQVDPDSTSNEVGSRSVLEFALHVERLRDLKHMLNLKSRGHHAHMTEMDSGENVPATNIWVARVVGLERQPSS